MFCQQIDNSKDGKVFSMTCGEKWVSEIFAFLSLICSIFIIVITFIKIKMNLMYILILQILISEIIDELNVLSGILVDAKGKPNFENYNDRMMICFTQIYFAVFTCLWTLTASLFISLKLYDIIVYKNKIFKEGSFMSKYTSLISISAPMILSYFIWAIQVSLQNKTLNVDNYYMTNIKRLEKGYQNVRMIFCWVKQELSIFLFIVCFALIVLNLYFSLFKGYFFVKKTKEDLIENNDESRPSVQRQIKNITKIQNTLFLYPVISCAIWLLFFVLILFFRIFSNYKSQSVFSWIFCIFISIRQIIYTLVYFLTQEKLKEYAILVLTFKTCKKKRIQNINNLNKESEEVGPIIEKKNN